MTMGRRRHGSRRPRRAWLVLRVVLAVAVGPVLVVLWALSPYVMAAGALAGCGVAGAVAAVAVRRRRRCLRQRLADLRAAEPAIAEAVREIYEDWVRSEVARGVRELDRWRRTHTP